MMDVRKDSMQIINKKNNILSTSQKIILFIMFLGAANFVGRYYYFVYIAFLFCCFLQRPVFRPNFSIVCLMILPISLIAFSPSVSGITDLIKPFTYFICYMMGYNMLRGKKNIVSKEQSLKIIIIVFAGANFFHLFLNLITNIGATTRNTIDFWTKSNLSATGQTALACLMIAVAYAILFSNSKTIYKALVILALAIIFYYNLMIAGRTIIVLLIVMLIVAYGYHLMNSDNKKQKIKILLLIIAAIALIIILYNYNVFNIKTIVEESNLYNRFWSAQHTEILSEDKRLGYKLSYLEKFLDYPWGGNRIKEIVGSYAHDLYLDTYDEAGIFAFLAVIIYIGITIKNLYSIQKSQSIQFYTKQLIFLVYVVLYIEFMIEPILKGMPWLLATFCFIDGAVVHLLGRTKNNVN